MYSLWAERNRCRYIKKSVFSKHEILLKRCVHTTLTLWRTYIYIWQVLVLSARRTSVQDTHTHEIAIFFSPRHPPLVVTAGAGSPVNTCMYLVYIRFRDPLYGAVSTRPYIPICFLSPHKDYIIRARTLISQWDLLVSSRNSYSCLRYGA